MLRKEYDNFQSILKGFNAPLYSATKQQAQRLLKRLREKPKSKEYPMILRRDVFNIKETKNKLVKFWVKIPIHHVRGGIKVPIQMPLDQEELPSLSIRERPFKCLNCGLEYNVDLNRAIKIAKRIEGYMLSNGVAFDTAHNSGVMDSA